jgi:hypothetical protein
MQQLLGPGFALLVIRIAFVVVLYLFLWTALGYVRRSLTTAVALDRPGPLIPRARLALISGTRPTEGEEIALGVGVHTMGRADTCTIQIPNRFVSALHAEIRYREGRFWLSDQSSRNGTTVNGEPIAEPVALDEDDRIGVGGTVLQFRSG